jgi:hypothetical protein
VVLVIQRISQQIGRIEREIKEIIIIDILLLIIMNRLINRKKMIMALKTIKLIKYLRVIDHKSNSKKIKLMLHLRFKRILYPRKLLIIKAIDHQKKEEREMIDKTQGKKEEIHHQRIKEREMIVKVQERKEGIHMDKK